MEAKVGINPFDREPFKENIVCRRHSSLQIEPRRNKKQRNEIRIFPQAMTPVRRRPMTDEDGAAKNRNPASGKKSAK